MEQLIINVLISVVKVIHNAASKKILAYLFSDLKSFFAINLWESSEIVTD